MAEITYFVSRSLSNEYGKGTNSRVNMHYELELVVRDEGGKYDYKSIGKNGVAWKDSKDDKNCRFSSLNTLADALLINYIGYRKCAIAAGVFRSDLQIKTGGLVPDKNTLIGFEDITNPNYLSGTFHSPLSESEMLKLYNIIYRGLRAEKVKAAKKAK